MHQYLCQKATNVQNIDAENIWPGGFICDILKYFLLRETF